MRKVRKPTQSILALAVSSVLPIAAASGETVVTAIGKIVQADGHTYVLHNGQQVEFPVGLAGVGIGDNVRITGPLLSNGTLTAQSWARLDADSPVKSASLIAAPISSAAVSPNVSATLGVTGSNVAGVTGSNVAGVTGSNVAGVTGSNVAGVTGSNILGVTGSN
jgi:hypothetical protein